MKAIQLATITLVLGIVATCPVYGQSPGYGGYVPPQDSSPGYGGYVPPADSSPGYGGYVPPQDSSPGYGGYVPPPGSSPGYDQDRGYDYGGWQSPQSEVGFFYEELSPYGDWVLTRDYGWAWSPLNVQPYWRPYNDGRWVITEYGWTWVSYERFGWATYHYGRWAWDSRFGWLWVPGTIWGPAWVSWEYGGGYVGWAPLPPSVGFQFGIGIRLGGFDLKVGIRPDSYNFVPERSFLEPRLLSHLLPMARNVTIIHSTKNITSYADKDNRVVNRGVDVQRIEQVTGRRVQQLHVVDSGAKERTDVGRSELRIFRPQQKQLESVRVGPRVDAGQRAETPATRPDKTKSANERRDVPDFVLAPRPGQTPRTDPKQLEKEERREQQELERYQAEEQRRLEKLHQQEIAVPRSQAERSQVERNQQAEREALQQQQRSTSQQLAVRQQAKRQAAQANPPGRTTTPQGEQRPAVRQQAKDKKDKKK